MSKISTIIGYLKKNFLSKIHASVTNQIEKSLIMFSIYPKPTL